MKAILAAAAIVLSPLQAFADFHNGNSLYQFCKSTDPTDRTRLVFYSIGASDQLIGAAFCPPQSVNAGQVADLICQHLAQHPETRDQLASVLIFQTLRETWPCQKR